MESLVIAWDADNREKAFVAPSDEVQRVGPLILAGMRFPDFNVDHTKTFPLSQLREGVTVTEPNRYPNWSRF